MPKGSYGLVEPADQKKVLTGIGSKSQAFASGGSVANSIIGFAQLGGKAGFISMLGDDQNGKKYREEMQSLGIQAAFTEITHADTGTNLCLIAPDGERTMRAALAVNKELSPAAVSEDIIARSEWILLEGYLLANPEGGQAAVMQAISLAKKHNTKVAFTLSEVFIPQVFGDACKQVVASSDLVFANEHEATAWSGIAGDVKASFEALSKVVPEAITTLGGKGLYVSAQGKHEHVATKAVEPIDLTGAGDMLAGAYLYGRIVKKLSATEAAAHAHKLASAVIMQVGARLKEDARALWNS